MADEAKPAEEADEKIETPAAEVTEAAEETTDAPEATEPTEATETHDQPVEVSVPDDLSELDEDALRAKFDELLDARKVRSEKIAAEADVDAIAKMAEHQKRIRDEIVARTESAKALAAKKDEVLADEVSLPDERIPQPIAAAAAAAAKDAPEVKATEPSEPKAETERKRAAFTAAMGTRGQAGEASFGDIVAASINAGEGKTYLASVEGFDAMRARGDDLPEPLSWGNIERNDELIHESQDSWKARQAMAAGDESEQTARTAAICDPLDIIREIPDAFTSEERVAPVFPARPAGRLGFQFTPSANLSDVTSGTGIFTETDQASVDVTNSATWKGIVDFACGTPSSVRALAVYAAARYDNTLEISSPERLANLRNALDAARARRKEGRVLNLLDATLGRNLYELPVGAVPALVSMLSHVVAVASDFNRLSDPSFTVVLPPGIIAPLVADVVKRQFADPSAVPDVLNALRSVPGVSNVVLSLDGTDAGIGQPGYPLTAPRQASDVPGYIPSLDGQTYRVRIFDPADYIYAETGEMHAGVYRSTNEIRQNKAVLFTEEYLMLAKAGPQRGQYVDITLCGSGRRATGFDPGDCSTGGGLAT